jgi:molybdenum cofactor cytidylyltransferase
MDVKSGEKIGAIVLGAGGSVRMGQPKQLLRIDGQSLIRRAALAAIDGGCNPVIVVTGAESNRVTGELAGLSVWTIYHANWQAGMGSSLKKGLDELQKLGTVSAVVVIVWDQPHMNAEIIRRLIDAWGQSGKSMAACAYGDSFGTPCCFGRSKFPELLRLPDCLGAKQVLSSDPDDLTQLPWPPGAIDLDLPDDLKIAGLEKIPERVL